VNKRWTVYCHIHVETGRRYVGLTVKTMLARWNQHVYMARYSKGGRWHFPNAIRKYGPEAFTHEVLEVCHDIQVANLAEECWISFYDTRNHAKGFNLAEGGQHIPHPVRKNYWDDPEYRARQVEAGRAWSKTPRAQAIYAIGRSTARGRTCSPETRAKIAAKITGPTQDSLLKRTQSRKRSCEKRREGTTHYMCKTHGPVPLGECYVRRNRPDGVDIFVCRECRRLSTRERRATVRKFASM